MILALPKIKFLKTRNNIYFAFQFHLKMKGIRKSLKLLQDTMFSL